MFSSKEQRRRQLEQDMEQFLAQGGSVTQVPRGISGADPLSGRGYQTALFNGPRNINRTDLSQVAAGIDARKKKGKPAARIGRPRRKLIYDDFGEPLRWVWQDTP